jgi:hypothetical protein
MRFVLKLRNSDEPSSPRSLSKWGWSKSKFGKENPRRKNKNCTIRNKSFGRLMETTPQHERKTKGAIAETWTAKLLWNLFLCRQDFFIAGLLEII